MDPAADATYCLTVSYRGGAYAGWQRQDNALAVQQVLEEALGALTGEAVRTTGAGRTDAGVHARGQAVSLTLSRPWPQAALVHGTNSRLPEDVRVLDAVPMAPGFDARRHALDKDYRYHLRRVLVLSPLDAWCAVRVDPEVDVGAMEEAAAALVGRHDFAAFAKAGGAAGDTGRRILAAEWLVRGEALTFRIVGEGFLRGMVRALVGTLLEVGRGRRAPGALAELLVSGRREEAGPSAPAHALVLQRVAYDSAWQRGPGFGDAVSPAV